jgi:hypothetical protein
MEQIIATNEYLKSQIEMLQNNLKNHQNCDYWKSENGRIQSQIIELINISYDSGQDSEDILQALCEIVDYNPVKEIEFTATIKFTGRIEIPRAEEDDFDLTAALEDAYVDINHGDIVIDGYELYDAEEC